MGAMASILEGRGVGRSFGGVRALDGVDFHVGRGEVLGLIGPNGAGKTTLINVISGHLRPSAGEITFKGRTITAWPAHRVTQLGIARTFQPSRAFLGMTVEDNILVGALFGTAVEAGGGRGRTRATDGILGLLGLAARRNERVQTLNVPDRKKVDLGRALAQEPELLLLDELMAGLNPADMEGLIALVRHVRERGISLVIIEHVMKAIVDLCDRVMVLHHGQKIGDGSPASVLRDRAVTEAYLGRHYGAGAAEGA
jgi:branched-chain amino acid transport system ATP-binding protein